MIMMSGEEGSPSNSAINMTNLTQPGFMQN